jgi:hypothetical protein
LAGAHRADLRRTVPDGTFFQGRAPLVLANEVQPQQKLLGTWTGALGLRIEGFPVIGDAQGFPIGEPGRIGVDFVGLAVAWQEELALEVAGVEQIDAALFLRDAVEGDVLPNPCY